MKNLDKKIVKEKLKDIIIISSAIACISWMWKMFFLLIYNFNKLALGLEIEKILLESLVFFGVIFIKVFIVLLIFCLLPILLILINKIISYIYRKLIQKSNNNMQE